MKKLLIIDGHGGKMGHELVSRVLSEKLPVEIIAVGTNSMATNSMMKAGAVHVATGENAVVYNAARADIIIGPIGVVSPNALLGEITERMASAVGGSDARKILIPVNTCNIVVAGVPNMSLRGLIDDLIALLRKELSE